MTPFRLTGRPLAVLAALVLSLLFACQREKDVAPAASQPLSIKEAKSWFDSHLGNAPSASPNGRTAKKPAREPDWPYAYKQKVKDKELVVVPLKLEKGYRSKGYLGKLLMFKDAAGNVQTQVVKASGTKAFLEKNNYNVHGEGFSGIVRVEDWDGKLIDGELYDNGKVVGRLAEGTASKGGRTQGYYITVVVYFYQQVCMGSDCGGWSYLDSQVKTVYVSDGYSHSYYYGTYYFASGSGGGSYGGGGSTSTRCPYGPNCNEPVPFDEQTFDIEVVQPVNWLSFMYKVKTYANPCDAYRDMINAGYAANDPMLTKELGGVIAKPLDASGNVAGGDMFIAFPALAGVNTLNIKYTRYYYDENGRQILEFWKGGGTVYVKQTTYSALGVPIEKMHIANTLVHTHPFDAGPIQYSNGIVYPNQPSSEDIGIAAEFPMLTHRTVSMNQIYTYNSAGTITSSQPNNCR